MLLWGNSSTIFFKNTHNNYFKNSSKGFLTNFFRYYYLNFTKDSLIRNFSKNSTMHSNEDHSINILENSLRIPVEFSPKTTSRIPPMINSGLELLSREFVQGFYQKFLWRFKKFSKTSNSRNCFKYSFKTSFENSSKGSFWSSVNGCFRNSSIVCNPWKIWQIK